MKYKVGDNVRIRSKEWYEKESDDLGRIGIGMLYFDKKMSNFCGDYAEIVDLVESSITGNYYYKLDVDCHENFWTDEMFDDSYSTEKSIINEDLIKDIAEVIKKHNLGVSISENDGKLIIEPLKVEEEEDLPIDTPVMAKSDNNDEWKLRYYAGKCKCYICGGKSNNEDTTSSWDCIIPCDRFNFENPKESLKYNIVK